MLVIAASLYEPITFMDHISKTPAEFHLMAAEAMFSNNENHEISPAEYNISNVQYDIQYSHSIQHLECLRRPCPCIPHCGLALAVPAGPALVVLDRLLSADFAWGVRI